MSFLRSMFSPRNDETNPQLAARLAQEPPTRIVVGTPNTWSQSLAALAPAVDVAGVTALYRSLGASGRYHLIEELGQFSEVFDISEPEGTLNFQNWMARLENPQGPYEKMFRGAMHLAAGWRIRGNESSVSVTDEQHGDFGFHLATALDFFIESGNELEGSDIVPFLHTQSCAYAFVSDALHEISNLWRSIEPFNRHGLFMLGQQIDERWFGNGEQQLSFAEMIAQSAPPGTDGLVIAAEIVQMRFTYLWTFEELDFDDAIARSIGLPRVQALLALAYEKLFNSGAATLTPTMEARHLNQFAWCFYRGENIPMGYDAILRMKGQIVSGLWDEQQADWDSAESFERARANVIEQVEFA